MNEPRPCGPDEAVQRARRLLLSPSNASTGYRLGTGDYRPTSTGGVLHDLPWTSDDMGVWGCDCAGFALCWAYKLRRHRDGYNRGPWSTVSDDINSNSAIEDAAHGQELFRRVAAPALGDLLAYPTFYLDGHASPWIGHVALVVGISRAGGWNVGAPAYRLLDIVQVCGGNGRTPAAIATDGHVFDMHDANWPSPLKLRGMHADEPKVSVLTTMLRAIP